MKRNYISFGIIILLIFATLIVFREPNVEAVKLDKIHEENEKLTNEISHLEEILEESDYKVEELKKEKEQLAERLFQLEEGVESLKGVKYQDLNGAIETVESYKNAKTIEEAMESLPKVNYFLLSDGDCPCTFTFGTHVLDWIPNGVLDLREFTIEKDNILLTYNTSEEIRRDYEFVIVKEDEWVIKEIKLR